MKRRRTTGPMGLTGSGLNAHMDEQAIPLQQLRTVRRCQRKIGSLMDELNQVAKQLATIWWSYPVKSYDAHALGEAVKALDLVLVKSDQVSGWLDDWILARQAKAQAGQERKQ